MWICPRANARLVEVLAAVDMAEVVADKNKII